MNINRKSPIEILRFNDLKPGSVFTLQYNTFPVWIKISTSLIDANAVHLESGTLDKIAKDSLVIPFPRATLNLE